MVELSPSASRLLTQRTGISCHACINVVALFDLYALRRQDRLEDLRGRILESYPTAAVHLVVMDVRDTATAEALPSSLPPGFTEVDILINNAGLSLGAYPKKCDEIFVV